MIQRSHFVSGLILLRLKELNLTQHQLSIKIGFNQKNPQFISNIIRGKCQFPPHKIKELSLAIGVPVEDVISAFVEDYKRSLYREVYCD